MNGQVSYTVLYGDLMVLKQQKYVYVAVQHYIAFTCVVLMHTKAKLKNGTVGMM